MRKYANKKKRVVTAIKLERPGTHTQTKKSASKQKCTGTAFSVPGAAFVTVTRSPRRLKNIHFTDKTL